MADNTKIEWTDATWNPITGCAVVSPGCTNCYAMKLAGTRLQHHPSRAGLTKTSKAGPVWTGEVRFNKEWLHQPLQWKRPRMIFVCAHGDLFAEGVTDEWLDQIFAVMSSAPQHTFQILTKRPERMREYLTTKMRQFKISTAQVALEYPIPSPGIFPILPLPNVWLGVSVEDQQRADERIPILLATPAAVRWLSAEPLIGAINIVDAMWAGDADPLEYLSSSIDWVVAGGESGPGARPMHPDWARTLRDQCADAGVPFLFKQWGHWRKWDDVASGFTNCSRFDRLGNVVEARARLHYPYRNGFVQPESDFPWRGEYLRFDKKTAGRLLDGVLHDAYPERP